MITTLIKIAFIVVIVWDVLQFPNEIANNIASFLTKGKITNVNIIKPFGCSLCMTFWLCLGWTLMTAGLSSLITNVLLCLLVAYSTTYIYMGITVLNNLIINLISVIEKLINHIH